MSLQLVCLESFQTHFSKQNVFYCCMLQFDAKITHISIISMKKLNSHFLKLYKLFYTRPTKGNLCLRLWVWNEKVLRLMKFEKALTKKVDKSSYKIQPKFLQRTPSTTRGSHTTVWETLSHYNAKNRNNVWFIYLFVIIIFLNKVSWWHKYIGPKQQLQSHYITLSQS